MIFEIYFLHVKEQLQQCSLVWRTVYSFWWGVWWMD